MILFFFMYLIIASMAYLIVPVIIVGVLLFVLLDTGVEYIKDKDKPTKHVKYTINYTTVTKNEKPNINDKYVDWDAFQEIRKKAKDVKSNEWGYL